MPRVSVVVVATALPFEAGRTLEPAQPLLQLAAAVRGARQPRVVLPPVDPHLARLVDGRDEETELDRQELDVEQVDRYVAGDHDALVENALEEVREAVAVPG